MQGGVNPDLPLSYYVDLLHFLRDSYPAIHRHCFSPPEIKFIAKKERMSFSDVIGVLKEAGLMSIPAAAPRSSPTASAKRSWPTRRRRPRSGSTSCARRTATACGPPRR